VRGLMEKAGVDKPVVCTEVGQPSAGPPAEGYSETLAAHEVFRNLTRAYAADMPVVIWHRLQDRAADTRLYGLINADGEPKAAYHAYQILANALNNATFIAPLSKAETGSSRLEAYHFEATDGTDLLVAWRTNSGKALTLPVEAGSVRVLDAEGNERSIQDGGADDGDQTAGVIGVPVSNVPVVILLQ